MWNQHLYWNEFCVSSVSVQQKEHRTPLLHQSSILFVRMDSITYVKRRIRKKPKSACLWNDLHYEKILLQSESFWNIKNYQNKSLIFLSMLPFSIEMLASMLKSMNLGLASCMVLTSTGYLRLLKKYIVFLLTANVLLFSSNSQAHKLRVGISPLLHMLETTKLTLLQAVFWRYCFSSTILDRSMH